MKKLLVIGFLALSLGGCASMPSTGDLSARAKQIQDYTRLACKFVPTVSTIANILSSGIAAPATMIAADICNAITTVPLADGGPRAAKVYGVAIKGKHIR